MRIIFSLISLLSFCITTALAHGDNRHFANKQDVQVKTTKVNGNVYMLQGRGGNVGALVGMEGILIVDDDYKAVGEKLAAALKELGSATPRYILTRTGTPTMPRETNSLAGVLLSSPTQTSAKGFPR